MLWMHEHLKPVISRKQSSVCVAGAGQQAFHVIAPSIPGFAFSSAPKRKGFGLKEMAKTFNQLMLELGYTNYVAQGRPRVQTLYCRLARSEQLSVPAVQMLIVVCKHTWALCQLAA